jgi:hypothetical protein
LVVLFLEKCYSLKYMKIILFLLFTIALANGGEIKRDAGFSVYMLPERVGALSGKHGGFVATDPETHQAREPISEPQKLITCFEQLSPDVQRNGMWIIITDPDAYSESEHTRLKNLLALCLQKNIAVFTCRAADLPNGWQAAR